MFTLLEEIYALLPTDFPVEVALLIQAAIALFFVFKGKDLFRFWLGLTGLALGAYIGFEIVGKFDLSSTMSLVVVILLALVGASIMSTAYKVTFFIAGFISGMYVGNYILEIFFSDVSTAFIVIFALGVAIFAVAMRDHFIIWATSITGSMLAADAAFAYLYKQKAGDLINRVPNLNIKLTEDLILLLIIVVLTALGIYYQNKNNKDKKKKLRF